MRGWGGDRRRSVRGLVASGLGMGLSRVGGRSITVAYTVKISDFDSLKMPSPPAPLPKVGEGRNSREALIYGLALIPLPPELGARG